jgi:hypothetical protein
MTTKFVIFQRLKFEKHIVARELMIQIHVDHVLIQHPLRCVFDNKTITLLHQIMCMTI